MTNQATTSTSAVGTNRLVTALFAFLAIGTLFLLGSTPIRNADFWRHLATGRLIAEGGSQFGRDPFGFADADWANSSWLFDWLTFQLHQLAGDGGIVLARGLLLAALGIMLLRAVGVSLPATVVTIVAFAACSGRFSWSPLFFSFLFFGCVNCLCLGLTEKPKCRLRAVLLIVTFVLWANVDSWFLLGLIAVGLFWAGGQFAASAAGRFPVWLLPACIVACLANPFHYHVFQIPDELRLTPLLADLANDPQLQSLVGTNLELGRFWHSVLAFNLSSWCLLATLGIGLLSILINLRRAHFAAVLLFLFGLALLYRNSKLAPFFAVSAVLVGSTGWPEMATVSRRGRVVVGLARVGWLGAAAALILFTWTGYLNGFAADDSRRVAWRSYPDATLVRGGELLSEWRQGGRFADSILGIALHPDAADYLSWYAPKEKHFVDSRIALHQSEWPIYELLRRELCPSLAAAAKAERVEFDWRKWLRDHKVGYLFLYDPDPRRVSAAFRELLVTNEWRPAAIVGQGVLFRWLDLETGWEPPPNDVPVVDVDRLAFSRQKDEKPSAESRAPDESGPVSGPDNFASRLLATPKPTSWQGPAALLYLNWFELRAPGELRRNRALSQNALGAGLAGQLAAATRPQQLALALQTGLYSSLTSTQRLQVSPAPILVALRLARRAVHENPDDARAWEAVGRAYIALTKLSGEAAFSDPVVNSIRNMQAVAALQNALAREPNREGAHQLLADLFEERGYVDVAYFHRRKQAEAAERNAKAVGTKQALDAANDLRDRARALEEKTQDRKRQLAVRTGSLSDRPFERASAAMQLGLPLEALDRILSKADVALFGAEGARLQIQLMLELGRTADARDLLATPELKDNRGKLSFVEMIVGTEKGERLMRVPAFEFFVTLRAAGQGDYLEAVRTLGQIAESMETEQVLASQQLAKALPFALVSEIGVRSAPEVLTLHTELRMRRETLAELQDETNFLRFAACEVRATAGLLRLEMGDIAGSEFEFTAADEARGTFPPRQLIRKHLETIRRYEKLK